MGPNKLKVRLPYVRCIIKHILQLEDTSVPTDTYGNETRLASPQELLDATPQVRNRPGGLVLLVLALLLGHQLGEVLAVLPGHLAALLPGNLGEKPMKKTN